jgi:cellulose synthase/poly-beta-1,6-N-acetylglucosamine synthase-like glycosyltransferase
MPEPPEPPEPTEPTEPAAPAPPLKIVIITPFHKTAPDIFRQCCESVANQTYPCTHLVVADGPPLPEFSTGPGRMLAVLPHANADYGNTPRAIGGLLADSYGFDAVAMLDDDNWLEPNHIESMLATQAASKAALIICQRAFRQIDGAPLRVTETPEDKLRHVDSNCWLIMRPAFALLSAWRVPKFASFIGDRIFYQKALRDRYAIAATGQRTVNYRTKFASHYINAGVPVPPGAYPPGKLHAKYRDFTNPARIAEITEAIGFYPKLY